MSVWKKSLGDSGRSPLVSALLLGVAIAACAGVLVSHLRERNLVRAGTVLERLALVLAQQADRSLQSVDLVQTGFIERLKGIETPEQYRREVTGIAVHKELRSRVQGLPQIHTLTVLDADGELLNFSLDWPPRPVNVSDREFFRALKSDPQRMTYISEPIQSRAILAWTVVVARKVVAPDGTFLGVVVAALNLPDFERLYEAVALGPSGSVTLFRQDGVQLARFPHAEQDIGRQFPIGARFQALQVAGLQGESKRSSDGLDGQERLVAIRLTSDHSLAIRVDLTVERALIEWRKLAMYLFAVTALLELVIIGFGLSMTRQLRGQTLLASASAARDQAEAELTLAHARENALEQARLQHARLRAALDHMSQGLAIFDVNNRLVVANARHAALLGVAESDEAPGVGLSQLFDRAVAKGVVPRATADGRLAEIMEDIANGLPTSRIRDLQGGRSLAIGFSPISEGGWMVTVEDVTERLLAEAEISHMAHHDALTGLANRMLFQQRLDQALAQSQCDQCFAVLCIDLDRFKPVNDSFGHAVGDALLVAVAERMLKIIRDGDTAARLGGDEFALILAGLDGPADAEKLAGWLIEALSLPYRIEGHVIRIGASIGIAMLPGSGGEAETVLKNADQAMYRAKSAGRGLYRVFDPGLGVSLVPDQHVFGELLSSLLATESIKA
jgi:diguanylate cyclase (GGDEF)-like protein